MLYHFARKDQPDAGGTRDYAFMPAFALPSYTLFGGGVPYAANRWPATQPEQVYYNQAQYLQGLIGIVAGQMAHVPLIDTRGVTG